MTVLFLVLLFVLLIFPHELGHFLAAKACGVQVNEFAFGMGPKIFSKQGGETLYSIRLVPIGGFCAMEGEDTEESTGNPRAFNNKKWWQKIIILVAGAAMNVLIAMIALTITFGIMGIPTTAVDKVTNDSPAMVAGIENGDVITEVNGHKTKELRDIVENVQSGEKTEIVVDRNGKTIKTSLVPEKNKEGYYVIGMVAKPSHSPVLAAKYGFTGTFKLMGSLLDAFKSLFTSKDAINQVSGPVGMVSIVKETTTHGGLSFLYLVAIISLNLAVFNLLPFPALDGGRILFVFIRLITGKAITDSIEAKVHALGMMVLLGFTVFVTWHDIVRLFQ